MRWTGHIARMDEMINAYKTSVGKSGRNTFGDHRGRWEDNIKKDLVGMCDDVDWILMAQDSTHWQPPVNTVINLWFT